MDSSDRIDQIDSKPTAAAKPPVSAKKRRKKTYNIIMAVAIVAMAVGIVLGVGSFQGWFSVLPGSSGVVNQETAVTAQNKVGNVNIERGGIAYALEDGTIMRDGDIVQTLAGSSISLESENTAANLDGNSEVEIALSTDRPLALRLNTGTMFLASADAVSAPLGSVNLEVSAREAVLSADVLAGNTNVRVYGGSVVVEDTEIGAGQSVTFFEDGTTPEVSTLSLQGLSAFDLLHLKSIAGNSRFSGSTALCFSGEELDTLEAERADGMAEEGAEAQEAPRFDESGVGSGQRGLAANGTADGATADTANLTCTIAIRCDSVLQNMDKLATGKDRFVPADGAILVSSRLSFTEGETVFDVLKRACTLAGIQLEYSWTPAYDSYYIEGIGNLYEFDCGPESGWTYQVNGWKPNRGCSSYVLQDGDSVVWSYSCAGTGQW